MSANKSAKKTTLRKNLSQFILKAIEHSFPNYSEVDPGAVHMLYRNDDYPETFPMLMGTIDPGIAFFSHSNYCTLEGHMPDVLAAGIAEPCWFADGRKRFKRKGGRKCCVRTLKFQIDDLNVETTTRKNNDIVTMRIYYADEQEAAFKKRADGPAMLDVWNGNRLVRWQDCAWQPRHMPA